MDNNYNIAYKQGWKILKERDLNRVSKIRKIKYRKDENIFETNILGDDYVLDFNKEIIYNRETLENIDLSLGIILLNYLGFSDESIKLKNEWISLKEIPNGGYLYYPAFFKSSIEVLIKEFGYSCEMFSILASSIGGVEYNIGDYSAVFNLFPIVPICIVIWEGDDEISPNATILFDRSIQNIMHIESIIGIGNYLVEKLHNLTTYLK